MEMRRCGCFGCEEPDRRKAESKASPNSHPFVTEVNELMAICDAMEVSLTAATTAGPRLLEATLAEAIAPATVHELKAAE